MHSMKIKRPLPPLPKVTTKPVRNNELMGYGAYTYRPSIPTTPIDLQIPPQRSNSQAAERERELKVILDLAREGKTASEIAEASGCTKVRVTQTIKRFAEYGAKLTPEPKKRKKRAPSTMTVWTEDMMERLITLHRAGLPFSEIASAIGVSKGAISSKVRTLVEQEVLKPRIQEIAWSQEDIDLMFKLREQGMLWGEIADRLGRKLTACHNAYRREKEKRKCLKG